MLKIKFYIYWNFFTTFSDRVSLFFKNFWTIQNTIILYTFKINRNFVFRKIENLISDHILILWISFWGILYLNFKNKEKKMWDIIETLNQWTCAPLQYIYFLKSMDKHSRIKLKYRIINSTKWKVSIVCLGAQITLKYRRKNNPTKWKVIFICFNWSTYKSKPSEK